MTFVFCVLICIRFRTLHSCQTCNMACSSRGQVDISARSSTYSNPPIQICVVPLCCRPGARLRTAWGNLWIRSATNRPNRVGARGGCQLSDVLEGWGARLEVEFCRCEHEGGATYDQQCHCAGKWMTFCLCALGGSLWSSQQRPHM